MRAHETEAVAGLVRRVFDAHVAPLFAPEGVATFAAYAAPDAYRERTRGDFITLVAEVRDGMCGMLELRHGDHVSLFFVETSWQGKGVGRALMREAVAVCRAFDPGLKAVTVNASPNAVAMYERMGFVATDEAQEMEGIVFTPMALPLDAADAG